MFRFSVTMFNTFAHYLISFSKSYFRENTRGKAGNVPDGPDLTSDPNTLHFESSSDMQNKPPGGHGARLAIKCRAGFSKYLKVG